MTEEERKARAKESNRRSQRRWKNNLYSPEATNRLFLQLLKVEKEREEEREDCQ